MVISSSTCQKDEKECTWVIYLINAVLSQFQICRNLRVFPRQIYVEHVVTIRTMLNTCIKHYNLVLLWYQESPKKVALSEPSMFSICTNHNNWVKL